MGIVLLIVRETFAIVQQSGQQRLPLRLQLLADDGTPDQLLVLLKHLQQLVHAQKQEMYRLFHQ